ncbi:pyridoxamine 5'-phosphate oxidase family protein [Acidovorax radicis]|uniref:pyridoxamine 5'-phosphate oxidase family protein n=1 Tax=Acidovorax radicis TaxID=758826 RepID=UPI0031343D4B
MSTVSLSLHAIRPCLEGAIPAIMATCDADGMPNVAYISQAVYVDEGHVALSFQFFNKTRQNILRNPRAAVLVLDPRTASFYRLHLYYERTEDHGPVFESMRAQLAGIASHAGMAASLISRAQTSIWWSGSRPSRATACHPHRSAPGCCMPCARAVNAWPAAWGWTNCWPARSAPCKSSSISAMRWCSCWMPRPSSFTRWQAMATPPPAWGRRSVSGRA